MGNGNTPGGQPGGLPKVNLFKDAPTQAHDAVPNQAPPVPPPVLTPPPAAPAPGQATSGQPASGSGKRAPLIAVGVGVALVAAIALAAVVSGSGGQDRESAGSAAGGVEASDERQTTSTDTADTNTSTPDTTATTNTTSPPPVAPAVDQSGNPIVDGWFILLSSALKGSAQVDSLPGVAASNGGHVVDTDSYQTGFATDGRSGSLNEQAAIAPNFWPGSNAVAAVIGPFPDQFAAEEACRQRGEALGNCVRQFRPLPTAPQ